MNQEKNQWKKLEKEAKRLFPNTLDFIHKNYIPKQELIEVLERIESEIDSSVDLSDAQNHIYKLIKELKTAL